MLFPATVRDYAAHKWRISAPDERPTTVLDLEQESAITIQWHHYQRCEAATKETSVVMRSSSVALQRQKAWQLQGRNTAPQFLGHQYAANERHCCSFSEHFQSQTVKSATNLEGSNAGSRTGVEWERRSICNCISISGQFSMYSQ